MSRLNVLLLLVVVICALSVVNATNRQRELFISLGRAQMQERALQQDLAQLQYQQSSLSKTSRVEDTATSELKMETVTAGRTQYLTVAGASSAAAGDATNIPSGRVASGAIASDATATDAGSAPAQVGDDTSNTATSSDLRAVISASAPAHAAKPAASGAQPASAPAKAASASSKSTAAGAKATNSAARSNKSKASTAHHTKTAHPHGASQ